MLTEEPNEERNPKQHPPTFQRKNTFSNLMRKVSTLNLRPILTAGSGGGVPITPDCKFKILVRNTKPEVAVSFLIVNMPGFVMCFGKGDVMFAEKITSDPKFWDRCTFHPCVNLWYDAFCAFESVRKASRYITFSNNQYKCRMYNGTESFKKEASFVFNNKKPEINPLKFDRKRRRAISNIQPPKFIHGKESVLRKFSHNPYNAKNLHQNELAFSDTGLYSMGYNPCVGCLKLELYKKGSSFNDDVSEIRPRDSEVNDVLNNYNGLISNNLCQLKEDDLTSYESSTDELEE